MTKSERNKWAAPALWLGLSSTLFAFLFVPPILAIVFGAKGMTRATILANASAPKTGKGMSIAGLILGIVYLGVAFYMLKIA